MSFQYIDIGEGEWTGTWFSKTSLVEFLRCRFRLYVSFKYDIPIDELKDHSILNNILEAGISFESEVREKVEPLVVENIDQIEPIADKEKIIHVPAIFRNHELGIKGIPDLIDIRQGRFLPVEIKNHKKVTRFDKLEIAFYWMLLDPLRTKKIGRKGYVVLNTGEIVEIKVSAKLLDEVKQLLKEMSDAIEFGIERCWSQECPRCNLSHECSLAVQESMGLSRIHNIAYTRREQFHQLGIKRIEELENIDEYDLNRKFMDTFGNTPGVAELRGMKCHATAFLKDTPVFFGETDIFAQLSEANAIVIDLEYIGNDFIWLVGYCVKSGEERISKQLFAENRTRQEEKRLLESVLEIKNRYPDYPLVTYNGKSAEMPILKAACKRHDLYPKGYELLEKDHVDLYYLIARNLRLPITFLGLKEIESYLNIERSSGIDDGLAALMDYIKYLRTKNADIKQQLLQYNMEDVDSTLAVLESIPQIIENSIRIQFG